MLLWGRGSGEKEREVVFQASSPFLRLVFGTEEHLLSTNTLQADWDGQRFQEKGFHVYVSWAFWTQMVPQ